MPTLYFFGSDKYSQIVLSHLQTHSDFNITHVPDLSDLPPIKSGTIGLAASFAHLFPPEIIEQFHGQLYNLHPSLLPQYRNVAPVPYAIALGDQETGITLQKIDARIDHGEIIAQTKNPILPEDTTPTLLTRLFTKGAELFLNQFEGVGVFCSQKILRRAGSPSTRSLHQQAQTDRFFAQGTPNPNEPLIFTHKLTRQNGYLEWDIVQKLVTNTRVDPSQTQNELVKLRLTHHPDRTKNILPDLIRALTGYEKVWTVTPTRKGNINIQIMFPPNHVPCTTYYVLISGKPRPISYSDFTKYYLNV